MLTNRNWPYANNLRRHALRRRLRPVLNQLEPRLAPDAALGFAIGVGGTRAERALATAVDQAGNEYVTGYFSGTANFNPSGSAVNLTGTTTQDLFLAKYNRNGLLVWAKDFASTSSGGQGNGLAVDSAGNVFITGVYFGTTNFNLNGGTTTATAGVIGNLFVAEYDSSGSLIWLDASTRFSQGKRVAVDASDNVYVMGTFTGSPNFNPGSGSFTLTDPDLADPATFVLKLDKTETFQWATADTSASGVWGYGLALDGAGGVAIAGGYKGVATFGTWGTRTSAGGEDAYVSELDASTGTTRWARSFGGTSTDIAYSVGCDNAGNVFVAGSFAGRANFEAGSAVSELTSAGFTDSDAFLAKFDGSGNQVGAWNVGGIGDDDGTALAVDGALAMFTLPATSKGPPISTLVPRFGRQVRGVRLPVSS